MNGKVTFGVYIEELVDFIAGANAISNLSKNSVYLDRIMEPAIREAEEDLNLRAAAKAPSISHMFEWGTTGVNGRSNTRQNPNSEKARLWKTVSTGRGLNRTIRFEYKKSKSFVPLPTTRKTRMPSDKIAMLNGTHIFYDKAKVMETGKTVTIKPKNSKVLVIPIRRGETVSDPAAMKRGYIVTKKSVTNIPGKRLKGNFTKFWDEFWNKNGHMIIENHVFDAIENDVKFGLRATSQGRAIVPTTSDFSYKVQQRTKTKEQEIMNHDK